MKLLCLIFAALVVFLSASPCCSDNDCLEDQLTTLTAKHTANQQTCNGCSPFFTCGTCAAFIKAERQLNPEVLITEETNLHFTVYKQPYIQDINSSIWQPPKLSRAI